MPRGGSVCGQRDQSGAARKAIDVGTRLSDRRIVIAAVVRVVRREERAGGFSRTGGVTVMAARFCRGPVSRTLTLDGADGARHRKTGQDNQEQQANQALPGHVPSIADPRATLPFTEPAPHGADDSADGLDGGAYRVCCPGQRPHPAGA